MKKNVFIRGLNYRKRSDGHFPWIASRTLNDGIFLFLFLAAIFLDNLTGKLSDCLNV